MKVRKLLFLSFFMTFSLQLNAITYRVIEMINEGGKKCYLFAVLHQVFSDINDANTIQRRDFIELAQQLDAAVIVEDAFIYNFKELCKDFLNYNNNDYYCSLPLLLFFKQDQDMLYGLSAYCYHAGIPVTNVECRFFHLLSNNEMHSAYMNTLYSQIKAYDDGPLLNEIYKQGLVKNDEEIALLYDKFENKSDFKLIADSWYSFGSDTNMFTSHLIDMRIMHQFAAYEKLYDTTFIAAGEWHISNIKNYLLKLGYMVKKTIEIYQSATISDASLCDIFADCFDYKPQNKRSPSLVLSMLDAKNFCDATPLKYVINRYGAVGLLGLISYGILSQYASDFTKSNNSLIYGLIATSISALGFKLVPMILRMPFTKKNNLPF